MMLFGKRLSSMASSIQLAWNIHLTGDVRSAKYLNNYHLRCTIPTKASQDVCSLGFDILVILLNTKSSHCIIREKSCTIQRLFGSLLWASCLPQPAKTQQKKEHKTKCKNKPTGHHSHDKWTKPWQFDCPCSNVIHISRALPDMDLTECLDCNTLQPAESQLGWNVLSSLRREEKHGNICPFSFLTSSATSLFLSALGSWGCRPSDSFGNHQEQPNKMWCLRQLRRKLG